MKKYKKLDWKLEIVEVEIIRETKEFVIYRDQWHKKEQRSAKAGIYFDTFEEAKAHFVAQYKRELQHADDARSRAISKLAKANALVPPAPALGTESAIQEAK